MDKEKQLGVFWGNSALYFVEAEATGYKKIFHVPFGETNKETIKDGPLSPGGMELVSNTQNILHKQELVNSSVNLSLPAKDIIFRSFIIPWMQQDEIKSVVEFEASKYVPFSLEKLSFSFHPIPVTENNTKRIRIVFVAIKNDTLRNYTRILEEASLHVNSIEPSASSLIRVLSLKNIIPEDQTVALIEREDVGRITIVNNGIPQFVREFHLPTPDTSQTEETDEASMKKIIGEARISLDYFNRQNEQLQVTKVLLLSSKHLEDLSQNLEKNLAMPVVTIDDPSILGDPSKKELGFLNAYGTSIISAINSSLCFNLSKQTVESPSKSRTPLPRKPFNYKSLIKTALVCIPLMVVSIIVSGFWTQKTEKDIGTLSQKLGSFQDADISIIEQKELELKDKLTYLKNVRMHSDAALLLLLIPGLLPEGTWIQSLDITYDDSAAFALADNIAKTKKKRSSMARKTKARPTLSVAIDGYAYSENRNEQFRLVNQLLKNLKDNKEFSSFFHDIDLETTKAQKLTEYSVTSFKILCKQTDEP